MSAAAAIFLLSRPTAGATFRSSALMRPTICKVDRRSIPRLRGFGFSVVSLARLLNTFLARPFQRRAHDMMSPYCGQANPNMRRWLH